MAEGNDNGEQDPLVSKLLSAASMKKEFQRKDLKSLFYPLMTFKEEPGATVCLEEVEEVFAFFENGDQGDKEICLMVLQQLEGEKFPNIDSGTMTYAIASIKPSTLDVLKHYIECKKSNFEILDED